MELTINYSFYFSSLNLTKIMISFNQSNFFYLDISFIVTHQFTYFIFITFH